MRTMMIAAVVAAAALATGPSQANEPVGCRRTAGPSGVPTNTTIGGVCTVVVPVTETTTATLRLTPAPGFTGWLTAKVTGGDRGGVSVGGVFVGGELVQGMDSVDATLVAAPDVEWKLTVTAGEPWIVSTYLFQPLPQQLVLPGVAAGEFGAEVVLAGGGPAA